MKKIFSIYWPYLFIVGVWIIMAHPYLINGLVPFPSRYLVDFFPPWDNLYAHPYKNGAMPDIITQIYPWKMLTIESLKSGAIPGWNPYQFSGNPHLANVQSAVFTPFNTLFFILPFLDAWSIHILLQPLLAGLFMFLFMRSLKVDIGGSILSSISFMFCGFMVSWMAYGTLTYAVTYMPLLFYGIHRYGEKQDFRAVFCIASSIPLSFFSGHVQMSIYVLIAGFSYALFSAWQIKSFSHFVKLVSYMGIGLLLSLPQLLPSFAFYQQAIRSELFRAVEAIPLPYAITMLAPDFFGNPVTRNDWYGHYAEWNGFTGTVTLVLAGLTVVVKNKSKDIVFFWGLLVATLFLALQTPLVSLLVSLKIPVISTSGTSRIIILFSFAMSVLGGFGLHALSRKLPKRIIPYLIVILCIVFAIWILLLQNNMLFISDAQAKDFVTAKRNFILPTILVSGTVCAIALVYFLKNKLLARVVIVLLLIAASGDMLRFASKWMPFDEREFVYPSLPVLEYMQQNTGQYRVYGSIGNEALLPFGLSGIEGYDPLYIRRYGELIQSATDGTIQPPERSVVKLNNNGVYAKNILDLLGVKYIFHSRGHGQSSWVFPFWTYAESINQTPVYRDEFYELYENTEAFDRAFLVHNYVIETEDQDIINRMFSSETDLRSTVVLEKNPDIPVDTCDAATDEAVDIVSYEPNAISIRVQASCPGLLVMTDNYYPSWEAYVNGTNIEILRADYSFRAVPVPAGDSEVLFTYEHWYL